MTTTHSQSVLYLTISQHYSQDSFSPEDAAYEPVRQLWNGKVKTRPPRSFVV